MFNRGRGRAPSSHGRGQRRGALGAWRALNPAVLEFNTFLPRMFAAIRAEVAGTSAIPSAVQEPKIEDPPKPQEGEKKATPSLKGFAAKGMTGGVPRGSFGVPGTPEVVNKVVKKVAKKRVKKVVKRCKTGTRGSSCQVESLEEIKGRHPSLSIEPAESLNEEEDIGDDALEEGEGPSQSSADKVVDDAFI